MLVDVPMVASQFLHQFWTAFDVLAQALHSGFDVLGFRPVETGQLLLLVSSFFYHIREIW